jgi:hypothetical protein
VREYDGRPVVGFFHCFILFYLPLVQGNFSEHFLSLYAYLSTSNKHQATGKGGRVFSFHRNEFKMFSQHFLHYDIFDIAVSDYSSNKFGFHEVKY